MRGKWCNCELSHTALPAVHASTPAQWALTIVAVHLSTHGMQYPPCAMLGLFHCHQGMASRVHLQHCR